MAWTDGVDGKPETVMRSFGLRIRILACPGEGATNPPRRLSLCGCLIISRVPKTKENGTHCNLLAIEKSRIAHQGENSALSVISQAFARVK